MDKRSAEKFRQKALELFKDGKSIKEIQTILGKSESVVYTYLRDTKAGVITGEEKAKAKREEVVKLYTVDKLTLKEISDRLGIAIVTLYKYLKRENIPLRENSKGVNTTEKRRQEKKDETLQIYMQENRDLSNTAKRLGITENTVRNRLGDTIKQEDKKPLRNTVNKATLKKTANIERTKALIAEGKTGEEIAEFLNVDVRTVYSYFKEMRTNEGVKRPLKSDKKSLKPQKGKRTIVKEEPPKQTKKEFIKPTIRIKEKLKQEDLIERGEVLVFPPIPESIRGKLSPDFLLNYKNVREKAAQSKLTTVDINALCKSIKQNRKISDILDTVFVSKLYEYIGDRDTAKKILFQELEDWRKVKILMQKQKPTNPIMEENYKKTQEKIRTMEDKIQERLSSLAIGEVTNYSIEQEEK